ncbi:peptidoglycan recognition protein [Streptomyces sp. NPDC048172]|uniref:peptidoglycan recognition protein family protein n=1 Tax=Streptomyces sp. NPDC048172 TaxID=3365505 RepID=UPI00371A4A29
MRAHLATSLGVVGAAALLLPLAPHVDGLSGGPAGDGAPPETARGAARASAAPGGPAASARRANAGDGQLAGSTQSLPFLAPETSSRGHSGSQATPGLAVAEREVRPYALLGVVWEHADAELHGRVQVRTRAAQGGRWTGWRELEAHPGDAPGELKSGGAGEGRERGATAPLWVGSSDAVQARVVPGTGEKLPEGLRLELVDPGPEPGAQGAQGAQGTQGASTAPGASAPGASAVPGASVTPATPAAPTPPGASEAPGTSIPASPVTSVAGSPYSASAGEPLMPPASPASPASPSAPSSPASSPQPSQPSEREETGAAGVAGARPNAGPRPRIVTRKGWGADEGLRESGFAYTRTVKAAFVHHTAMSNNYRCSQAPSIIRSIYRYHVKSSKWRDIGYNFLVDKCGTIYEGRAGGVAKAVMGAHTYGFNTNSTGIAVIGSFGSTRPPAAVANALSKLSAWKLGLYGVNPRGTVTLTSGGGKYKKGTRVKLHTISGHRDGFNTACPGAQLYRKLGTVRAAAARLQGR